MLSDMHIHSKYSHDSESKIYDIVKQAEKLNLDYIGIIDHVEFGDQSINEIIHRINQRNKKIDEVQNDTKIKILKGVEISEPHKYKEEMKYIENIKGLDYVLGAIHHVLGVPIQKLTLFSMLDDLYIESLYNMVEYGNIDAVAHLDLIKKFIKMDSDLINSKLEEVLKLMIKKNILLEINSNAYDIIDDYSPSIDIVSYYKALGGKNVILGSDAHKTKDIYRYLDLFNDNDLNECVVEKRRIKKIK